jgi:uncharacterized protein with GYD domain
MIPCAARRDDDREQVTMAYYLLRAKYAQDSMNALVQRPEDRLLTTTRLLKEVGGRLHYYFFCFGEYDIVLLFELPDNVSAAALAMTLSAAGTVTATETIPLLTMEEAIDAMNQAREASGIYVPPGRGSDGRGGRGRAKDRPATQEEAP